MKDENARFHPVSRCGLRHPPDDSGLGRVHLVTHSAGVAEHRHHFGFAIGRHCPARLDPLTAVAQDLKERTCVFDLSLPPVAFVASVGWAKRSVPTRYNPAHVPIST